MKILVIEDKPAEMEKALEIAKAFGIEAVGINPAFAFADKWMDAMVEFDGIITDLMWKPYGFRNNNTYPSGLLAVIHALSLHKPVVICTDAREVGGHHGEAIGWVFDGYMSCYSSFADMPYGWEEHKDWGEAFTQLLQRLEGR